MNKELTNKLRNEFPILFGPNEYAEFLRGFGFECGDGWYELIREFAVACEEHSMAHPDEPVTALIVKEKFGELRIQGLTNMTDKLWKLLSDVENRSLKTCEECGAPGVLRIGGWYVTRCDKHNVDRAGNILKPADEDR